MRLLTTKRFEKDPKRGRKRGKNLDKLWSVVERLYWLLVWDQQDDTLILVRTGTHTDLFD